MDKAKNKAKVTREDRPQSDPSVEESNHYLRKSGQSVRLAGSEYLGSVCVHYYRKPNTEHTHTFQFGVMASLKRVDEGNADVGLKELRKRMMQYYGRDSTN